MSKEIKWSNAVNVAKGSALLIASCWYEQTFGYPTEEQTTLDCD